MVLPFGADETPVPDCEGPDAEAELDGEFGEEGEAAGRHLRFGGGEVRKRWMWL